MPYPKGDYYQSLMWEWKPGESFAGRGALALEDSMATLKSLIMVSALLVGGASLAVAQNGPAAGGQPPVAGGAAGNPAAPDAATSVPARTVRHYGHRMYMMSVNRAHKGSKLTPDDGAKPLSEWLHRP